MKDGRSQVYVEQYVAYVVIFDELQCSKVCEAHSERGELTAPFYMYSIFSLLDSYPVAESESRLIGFLGC